MENDADVDIVLLGLVVPDGVEVGEVVTELETAVHPVLPANENWPPLQLPLQLAVVNPAVRPYNPALQFVHAPAAASEYWPAGHRDAVDEVEPAGHA